MQPDGREALCSTGYSPMLSFDVVDLQDTITRLISMGAHLDGPIRYPTFGKVSETSSAGRDFVFRAARRGRRDWRCVRFLCH